ncbi:MAG: Hsp20/alpha crystallin family protein [Verrucomicrobiae bacterium]|nr:Hsp20/alpha crystallin family protein [Verrucomicrobiae bacterium]
MARRFAHHLQSSLYLVRLSTPSSSAGWAPNTDVYENEESFVVRIELAGVSREDLHITLIERALIVRGRRPDPCRVGRCRFRQMEIDYGDFECRFVVPRAAEGCRIKADLTNGFLTIELSKPAKLDLPPRKVAIQGG